MKYLCLVYMEAEKLHAVPDAECRDCGADLRARGLLLAAEALQPVDTATTVRVRNGSVSVTDGPFAETTERATWTRPSRSRRRPRPAREGSIEARPIRELSPDTGRG